MRFFLVLLALTTASAVCTTVEAQVHASGSWEWSPSGFAFQPLRAAVLEPRVGSFYQFGDDRLRLDIGNSLDVLAYRPDAATEFRAGADFFTYTRLRSQGRFKFPVETTDFFFGINCTVRHQYSAGDNVISGRLRIAHISSHISDGYAGSRQPFVYSREFIDLTGAYQTGDLRVYAGANLLFSTIPDDFGIVTPQVGFDMSVPLAPTWSFVAGYDFRLPEIAGTVTGAHAAQAGVKLGERYGRGIVFSGYAYSGKSIHGMFYDMTDRYVGVGFQVDL